MDDRMDYNLDKSGGGKTHGKRKKSKKRNNIDLEKNIPLDKTMMKSPNNLKKKSKNSSSSSDEEQSAEDLAKSEAAKKLSKDQELKDLH